MEKNEKKKSVAEKSSVMVKSNVRGKNSVKTEIKGLEEKSRSIKPKASTQESKDSQVGKPICQNKVKDVSLDILYKDIMEGNRKFRCLKMELDGKEDEIEFLNIVINDKDSKISRLEKEIASKNNHIENIKSKLSDQVGSPESTFSADIFFVSVFS